MSADPADTIENLTRLLAKLPGLGPRSARRAVLSLIQNPDHFLKPLGMAILDTAERIRTCSRCGNIGTSEPCAVCRDHKRDKSLLCVVEDVADLWALERSSLFRGYYHVLGGTLSAFDGIGPEELNIEKLIDRVQTEDIKEVILAMGATIEGQTTAHYIAGLLREYKIEVSALAHGVPVGGELDYLDDGTLGAALRERRSYTTVMPKK